MPRYVILTHDHPFPHWDFLLEQQPGGMLRAWRLLSEPAAGACCLAEPLPDHRPLYLDYEGPVSGDRGTVARWDWGEYSPLSTGDAPLSLQLQSRRGLTVASLAVWSGRPAWRFG
jgi:hypothetical protein